jgi:hypothetical protein
MAGILLLVANSIRLKKYNDEITHVKLSQEEMSRNIKLEMFRS